MSLAGRNFALTASSRRSFLLCHPERESKDPRAWDTASPHTGATLASAPGPLSSGKEACTCAEVLRLSLADSLSLRMTELRAVRV